MSRILGIISSTPSNNMLALGIDDNCLFFGIEECLKQVDYPPISNVSPATVIEIIWDELGVTQVFEEDTVWNPELAITFMENPFTGHGSISNGCVLENDIFPHALGPLNPIRKVDMAISPTSSPRPTIYPVEVLKDYLNPQQIKKYEAAAYLNYYSIIMQLKEYVDSDKNPSNE